MCRLLAILPSAFFSIPPVFLIFPIFQIFEIFEISHGGGTFFAPVHVPLHACA